MEPLALRLNDFFKKHELSEESLALKYGTSGYRCNADLLRGVAARIGAFACLLSAHKVSQMSGTI